MSNYLGAAAGGFPVASPTSIFSDNKVKIGACVACIVALLGTYVLLRKPGTGGGSGGAGAGAGAGADAAAIGNGGGALTSDALKSNSGGGGEGPFRTDPPETTLASFAFEPMLRPGFVPSKKAILVKKPVGNQLYKLINCSTVNAYAIRWQQRYLVVENGVVKWSEERQEPGGCWKLVSGQCGGDKHVMLRNMNSRQFLRAEETSGKLVCRDGPTARTAKFFCWKVNVDNTGKQPCGTQYSYDLGRVINVPCNVVEVPKPGASCSSVTPGYQAKCCATKKNGAADAYCNSTYFPQVVGRSLQEGMLFLRTRFPQLIIKPCPEGTCPASIPVQNPNMIIIPFDARTNLITSPAQRLV